MHKWKDATESSKIISERLPEICQLPAMKKSPNALTSLYQLCCLAAAYRGQDIFFFSPFFAYSPALQTTAAQ